MIKWHTIFAGLALVAYPTLASARGCWVLQAATLETSSGVLNGFTAWLEKPPFEQGTTHGSSCLGKSFKNPPASAEIRNLILGRGHVPFYSDISKIRFPKEMLVTTNSTQEFEREKVLDVRLSTHSLNGFMWYARLNNLGLSDSTMLQKKPLYSCDSDETFSDGVLFRVHWLSYNPEVGKRELWPLCREPLSPDVKKQWQYLKQKGVFRLYETIKS